MISEVFLSFVKWIADPVDCIGNVQLDIFCIGVFCKQGLPMGGKKTSDPGNVNTFEVND